MPIVREQAIGQNLTEVIRVTRQTTLHPMSYWCFMACIPKVDDLQYTRVPHAVTSHAQNFRNNIALLRARADWNTGEEGGGDPDVGV